MKHNFLQNKGRIFYIMETKNEMIWDLEGD